jgi:hypothetical protein
MEGQRLGRSPLNIDFDALVRDRLAGISMSKVAEKYGVSRPVSSGSSGGAATSAVAAA